MSKQTSFIDYPEFDEAKTTFLVSENAEKKMTFMTPIYNYQLNKSNRLYVATPFMQINSHLHWDIIKNKCSITVSLAELDFSPILGFISKYDDTIKNKLDNKTISTNNNNKIKFHLKLENGKILSDVTNYNISKKYPKVEKINDVANLNLKFSKGKHVRFLLKPSVWVNKIGDTFGSFFEIEKMEIKYSKATVDSEFDKDTWEYTSIPNNIKIEI